MIKGKVMKKNLKVNNRKRSDLIFYCCLMAYPVIQFLIFYVYVNFNSFFLAFQKYDINTKIYFFSDDALVNFRRFFNEFSLNNGKLLMIRSIIVFLVGTCISTPFTLYLSFVVYKKIPMHKTIRILLYAPTIISSTVFVLLYTQMCENAIPALVNSIFGVKILGLLSNTKITFFVLLFFGIWQGCGGGTLLYISAMSGVPEEQVEAMKLDGANSFVEFFKLTLPYIWPTLSIFLYTGVTGLLTADLGLYTFYGEGAPSEVRTFGYYIYILQLRASQNIFDIPYIAAIGMLQSAIVIPLMFVAKFFLEKIGPKTY